MDNDGDGGGDGDGAFAAIVSVCPRSSIDLVSLALDDVKAARPPRLVELWPVKQGQPQPFASDIHRRVEWPCVRRRNGKQGAEGDQQHTLPGR